MHSLMETGSNVIGTSFNKPAQFGEREPYDFPVALEDAYTKDGVIIPKIKVVMRQDERRALSAVSDKYLLVPHSVVIAQAEKLISGLGTPQRHFVVTKGGASMIGTFTYREHLRTVKVGDQVGLRVYFENSYNTTCAVRISIGALVLSCLNGMVSTKGVYNFTLRHSGSRSHLLRDGMSFPEPGQIMGAFERQSKTWEAYANYSLPEARRESIGEELVRARAMPSAFLKSCGPVYTVWDAMQQATWFVTHRSPRLSPNGRMERLERVSKFFEEEFKV